jgi:hypothetical protein
VDLTSKTDIIFVEQQKQTTASKVEVDFRFATPYAICDFLRREDELMTELMNHKRSTS